MRAERGAVWVSPAGKVGLSVAVALAVLAGAGAWLVGVKLGPKGYAFTVGYRDVQGLLPGSGLYLMGVKIGVVEQVAPDGRMVRVKVRVDRPEQVILKGSRFKIMAQGLIGEKNLEVFPPRALEQAEALVEEAEASAAAGAPDDLALAQRQGLVSEILKRLPPLKEGDQVRGDDPARLELVMDELREVFEDFRKSADPAALQALVTQTANNLFETTEAVRRIGSKAEKVVGGFERTPGELNRVLRDADVTVRRMDALVGAIPPSDVKAISHNLRDLSRSLMFTYRNVFGSDQSQVGDNTLSTVRSLTVELEKLARTLNSTASDPGVQSDIKDTIRNLRMLTQNLSGATGMAQAGRAAGLQDFKLEPRVQGVALVAPQGWGLAGNLGVRATYQGNYLFGGFEQIGEGFYSNLLFGGDRVYQDRFGYHLGLIRSKLGLGLDYAANDQIELMAQLYDPFRPTVRLGVTAFPFGDSPFGVMGQAARTFATGENTFWAGVEWRPRPEASPGLVGPLASPNPGALR